MPSANSEYVPSVRVESATTDNIVVDAISNYNAVSNVGLAGSPLQTPTFSYKRSPLLTPTKCSPLQTPTFSFTTFLSNDSSAISQVGLGDIDWNCHMVDVLKSLKALEKRADTVESDLKNMNSCLNDRISDIQGEKGVFCAYEACQRFDAIESAIEETKSMMLMMSSRLERCEDLQMASGKKEEVKECLSDKPDQDLLKAADTIVRTFGQKMEHGLDLSAAADNIARFEMQLGTVSSM